MEWPCHQPKLPADKVRQAPQPNELQGHGGGGGSGAATGSSVLHRTLYDLPKTVVKASGLTLTLNDGQEIVDASGGAAVTCLGHGNEAVKQAMVDQLNRVSYCHSLFYGTSAGEELAASLIASTGYQMAKA